jgi:hypothetical protein
VNRGRSPRPSAVNDRGRNTINDVPQGVLVTALGAFDALRPGAVLLDLVDEPTFNGQQPALMRFTDGTLAVLVRVDLEGEARHLTVDIPGQHDLTVALEQRAPSLRLVRTGTPPIRFADVHAGLFSIIVTLSDPREPDRCTAWSRV